MWRATRSSAVGWWPRSAAESARPSWPCAPAISTLIARSGADGAGLVDRQAVHRGLEPRRRRVLGRDHRVGDGPLDADVGVVPRDRQLVRGVVEVGALVLDVHVVAEHAEA